MTTLCGSMRWLGVLVASLALPALLRSGLHEVEDVTPPTVVETRPEDDEQLVSPAIVVEAIFSEALDSSTIDARSFVLSDSAGSRVAARLATNGKRASLYPVLELDAGTEYTAVLGSAIRDLAGNPLAEYRWTFTTDAGDIGPPKLLELHGDDVGNATVVMEPHGDAAAIWLQPRSENARVWVRHFDAASGEWNASGRIRIDTGSSDTFNPTIQTDGHGNLMALWEEDGHFRSEHRLFARWYDSGEGVWDPSGPVRLDDAEGFNVWAEQPQVAVLPGAAWVAAWVQDDFRGHGRESGVFLRVFDPRTETWNEGGPIRATDHSGHFYLASSGRGMFHLAWTELHAISIASFDWKLRKVDFVSIDVAHPHFPRVAASAKGTAMLVWSDQSSTTPGSEYGIAAIHFDGERWQKKAQTLADLRCGGGRRPLVGMDASGNAFVVWDQVRCVVGKLPVSVFARRFDERSRTWEEAPHRIDAEQCYWEMIPRLAVRPDGSAIVFWSLLYPCDLMAYRAYSPDQGWQASGGIHGSAISPRPASVAWSESGGGMLLETARLPGENRVSLFVRRFR